MTTAPALIVNLTHADTAYTVTADATHPLMVKATAMLGPAGTLAMLEKGARTMLTEHAGDLAAINRGATFLMLTLTDRTAPAPAHVAALYIDDNGRTACAVHGGAYLTAAIGAAPLAPMHFTPLGSWVRTTDPSGFGCENCGAVIPTR